jgi:uncharacterized protein YdhG (YjbR/CyaY superfamily)
MTERRKYTSVEDYFQDFSGETAQRLQTIQNIVRTLAPESSERMSYNIPASFIGNKIVVYYSGYEHHVSLYPGKVSSETIDPRLAQYFSGKSTLKFPNDKPLPIDAITDYISERVNNARSQQN